MWKSKKTRRSRMRNLLALLVFAVTLAIFVSTLPRGILPGDSGELVAASHTLSIAHPPGYPMYVMVGKLFASAFAWGSIAARYNLLSALMAAATAALLFIVLVKLNTPRLIALAVTLTVATLEIFRLQATTAEVYALNGLLTVILLLVSLLGNRYRGNALVLLCFIGGLSISHHLSLVYPLVSALVILILGKRVIPDARTLVLCGVMLLVGLSAWLYIPIRSSLGPPLTWDRTHTLSGFISHITAQGYGWRVRPFDVGARGADFIRFFGVLGARSGVTLALLGLIGLAAYLRRSVVAAAMLCLLALFAIHFALYNIPDIEGHVFPALIGLAVLAAMGLERLWHLTRILRPVPTVIVVLSFVMIVPNLVAIRSRGDEWFADDYVAAIRASARAACGDSCLIISGGDPASFPLLYASLTEPGPITAFDIGLSNPVAIGATERPRTVGECVDIAAKRFDTSRIALLGLAPPAIGGERTRICGMVYTIGERQPCPVPTTYAIRGLEAEKGDYASRLLGGSYHLHMARWHIQEGDTASAHQQIEEAMRTASDDAGTHIYAARLYLETGDPEHAFRLARAALDIDPDFFEAHDLMGNLLFLSGRTREAVTEFEAALEGNPNPAPLYSNLGNAYYSLGEYPTARRYYGMALGLDSTLVNARLGLGRTLEATGGYEEALGEMRRARRLDPHFTTAYHAEASLLLRLRRHVEAMDVLRTGLRSAGEDALLLSDLGLLYLRGDNLDSAIVYLERALESQPTLLTARGNLAVAFEAKGDAAAAAYHYRTYIEAAPPGDLRNQATRALNRLLGSGTSTD